MDLQQYFHVLGLMFQQKYGGFYTSKYSFMFQKMNQLKGSTHKKLSNSAWSQHWPQSAGCPLQDVRKIANHMEHHVPLSANIKFTLAVGQVGFWMRPP